MNWRWIVGTLFLAALWGVNAYLIHSGGDSGQIELLNVSYDPTRELWRDLNEAFIADYQKKTGVTVNIQQSHGGRDARAGRGLAADAHEALLQRRQDLEDAVGARVVAHQADAPDLALEIAQAAADLDAEIGQQLLAHC